MNKGRRKNTGWEATIAGNNQRTIWRGRKHGGKAEGVTMSGYKWKGGNGEEIINDIRRGYNLYKRPRFQREGMSKLWLQTMSGPGEVASPAHSVSGSILQAPAVPSSHECLSYRCCSEKQREADLGRSARPDAIAPVALNPSFGQRY